MKEILKELLAAHNMRGTEFARQIGTNQSNISRILNGKIEQPSDELARKIADFFGLNTDQIRGYSPIPSDLVTKTEDGAINLYEFKHHKPYQLTAIRGMAKMGQDGYYEQIEEGIEGYIELPIRSSTGFALIARGDSMYPAIKDGFVVWCDIASQFVPGDNVAVHKRNGAKMIKEYKSNQNGYTELKSINGGEVLRIPNAEIENIYLIRGVLHPSAIRHID